MNPTLAQTTDRPITATAPQSATYWNTLPANNSAEPLYTDCQAAYKADNTIESGVYIVYSSQFSDSLRVYCDMNSALPKQLMGGWLVSSVFQPFH